MALFAEILSVNISLFAERCLILNKTIDMYIHQLNNWTDFKYSSEELVFSLAQARYMQGRILGEMQAIGFTLREEALLTTLTLDVLKSTEIEGELLNKEQVRSSIARRLGINIPGMVNSGRDVDGVVEMLLDATQNYKEPLTHERLFGWHAALFPTGWSGMYRIEAGKYRTGEMQVVSGAMGKERVHYEAPKPESLYSEMDKFLLWFNSESSIDYVVKAAIAHLWFITIHPFDDGNGRIARAITDMLLARSDGSSQRFYSMSNQILSERKTYYDILEKTQHGNGDITNWILWFIKCLEGALLSTEILLESILVKARFWDTHVHTPLNERQRTMLNKLLDGFEGKLTSGKWAKITKCSADTALNDIKDLMAKNILCKAEDGGRSTNYILKIKG